MPRPVIHVRNTLPQPGLQQADVFVRLNATDRAAYEAFISAQTGLPLQAVGVKSFAGPSATEFFVSPYAMPTDYSNVNFDYWIPM
jgi:hypothetical protein